MMLVLTLFASASVAAQPEVSFASNSISVRGEPGATFVVFAVGLEPIRYGNRLYRQQLEISDTDNDGLVVQELRSALGPELRFSPTCPNELTAGELRRASGNADAAIGCSRCQAFGPDALRRSITIFHVM